MFNNVNTINSFPLLSYIQNTTTTTKLDSMTTTTSTHHHHSSRSQSGFRNSITWFFITLLILYILYSSKLLLNRSDNSDCSLPSKDTLETQNNRLQIHINSTPPPPPPPPPPLPPLLPPIIIQRTQFFNTELKHIVFGIAASANLWDTRKEYIKLWCKPGEVRGVVWLDEHVKTRKNEGLPEIHISSDTSELPYTNQQGQRSALRISRVVSDTLRLGMKDVRWFIMGDDDTVFVVENVVRVLSKYDHKQFYYVGMSSESHVQNMFFSYAMAFGGGGFAISYPLAQELAKMQDRCITRYPGLYGSDDRMQACMAELGVPLTRERGFHQYDVYGNLLGLLGAHPVTPLVSLHHLDVVDPIFPQMTRVQALKKLLDSAKRDSASIIQQSICYDKRRDWSISVSWGFVVQIIRGVLSPRELEMPTRTFLNWYKRADYTAYAFNTRPVTRHPCQKPYVFYLKSHTYDEKRRHIVGVYARHRDQYPYCRWRNESPETVETIIVMKRPDHLRWQKSPRRDCCRALPSGKRKGTMYIWVGKCREGEISEL